MAEDAIKSHAGSDRHKTFMKEKSEVRSFFNRYPRKSVPAPANNASSSSCSISVPAVDSAPDNADAAPHVADNVSSSSPSTSVTTIDPASSVLTIDPDPVTTHTVTSPAEKVFLQSTIDSNVLCRSVSRAKIICVLFSMCEALSNNSSKRISQTFLSMFPDHPVVEKFQLAQTKLMYITNFGLAPHFQNILKQMDLGIRFWNKEMMQVEVRYWNSEFLGHAKHMDLVEHFNKALEELDLSKIIQISMDGPNVNWRFFDEIVKWRNEMEMNPLINLGSCRLHILHGAFKSGIEATDWSMAKLILKGDFPKTNVCFSTTSKRIQLEANV